MDAAERLADYLAGELDADEHAAVEAALARDPALRAELEDLQRADDALAELASPSPPEGFELRLRAALIPELSRHLGRTSERRSGETAASRAETPDGGPSSPGERIAADEQAAARARREARAGAGRGWRWLPVFGGVAASLLVLAVAVSIIGPLGGDDDDALEVASGDADGLDDDAGVEDDAELMEDADGEPLIESQALEEEEAEDAGGQDEAFSLLVGPDVVASGRDLEPTAADGLLDVGAARTLAADGLDADAGRARAGEWAAALGVSVDEEQAASDDVAEEDLSVEGVDPLTTLSPADRASVGGCLADLLDTEREGREPAIPAYVELVTVADEPAVAFVLVAPDVEGRFTVPEAWVLALDDCRVLATAEG